MDILNLKVIACEIMAKQIDLVSPCTPHLLDITTLEQHYHNTPSVLRTILQEEIDRAENSGPEKSFDAIVLGFGLCSNAVCGLKTRNTRLVIPKMHDCISLFLGSSSAYLDTFYRYPGTFFYNYSWTELAVDQGGSLLERKRAEYMEKYDDEEYVDALMEAEEMMLANYRRLAYIRWSGLNDEIMEPLAKKRAEEHNWEYLLLEGNSSLLEKMLCGNWNPDEFLILDPGQSITATGDDRILSV